MKYLFITVFLIAFVVSLITGLYTELKFPALIVAVVSLIGLFMATYLKQD